jgi:inorganic pyrophosphatase
MSHFFKVYKELEGKETATEVNDACSAEDAKRIVEKAINGYIENYCR